MYYVKYGKSYLHDPRTDDRRLIDLKFEAEENVASKCEFVIYNDHPLYNSLEVRDIKNEITVYDDEYEMFRGYISEIGKEFYLNKTVKCVGELSYLNDTLIRPYATASNVKNDLEVAPSDPSTFLEWLINKHNAQAGSKQDFQIGHNYASILDKDNSFYSSRDDDASVGEIIKEELLETYGGVIQIRRVDGVRYLDYLTEWSNVNAQILDFGVNLLDYQQTDDASSIITYIVPRGAKMSDTEYGYDEGYFKTSDKKPNKDKTYYIIGYEECPSMQSFTKGVTYYRKTDKYYRTKDTFPVDGKTYYYWDKGKWQTASIEKNAGFPLNRVRIWEKFEWYWKKPSSEKKPVKGRNYYTLKQGSSKYTACNKLTKFAIDEDGLGSDGQKLTYYEYDEYRDQSNNLLNLEDYYLDKEAYGDRPLTDDGNYMKEGDKIVSLSSVSKYGMIGGKFRDTKITTYEDLADAALLELKKLESPKRTIEIKAVDLSLINKNYKSIKIGDYVRVRSKPHNFDSYMLCKEISLDLNNPENSEYVLGETFDTLTGQSNAKIKMLNSKINTVYEKASAMSEKAKKAAKDALDAQKQIVKAETLWYVSTSNTEPTGGEWVTIQPTGGE